MRIAALLLAAGPGSAPAAAVRRAAEALLAHVDVLQPVGDALLLATALDHSAKLRPAIAGGDSRAQNVRRGLEALDALPPEVRPDLVLVHDGSRPCVSPRLVGSVIAALRTHEGAVFCLPVGDSLKRVAAGRIAGSVTGHGLYRAQSPQGFAFLTLRDLYRAHDGTEVHDDAVLLERAGIPVALVEEVEEVGLPEAEPPVRASRPTAPLPRTGTGFDVHAFGTPRPLMLCGVEVAHERGLAGHSDADVGLHALCDAIYGALAEGDIGQHFPPSEADWKDADSARFLIHAAERIAARGGMLVNADVTLICERPKIGPNAARMRERLAALLRTEVARISVKATTTERLGFTGRGEGIACQASATVLLP